MSKKDDLEIVIGADLSGLASDLAQTRTMFQGLARDVARMAPRSADLAPGLGTAAFGRVGAAAKGAGLSVRSLAADVVGFGAKLAVAGGSLLALEAGLNGISGALDQVKGSVVMAAEFEQNQIAFETMLGSAEKAAQVMGDLRKFAADTPFSSKEVTESARQLLAYGFAADEIIPSLKTIGTFAVAAKKPLGEMVYNVGTTKVQGRATQLDINQLTGKGIDVYPELAKGLKVDQAEVRKFVEDGRADWNVYKTALVNVGNTRFAGLLAKQADSLTGSWEQLTDAFDKAKLKLGQVIAQEVGLRGVSKDLEGFAGRIERAFDSDRFRGAVRFVGDLVKGGAQLASEFGRVAIEIAKINLDGLEHVSPQFKTLAKDITTFVAGIKDFKFDKKSIASAGLTIFEGVAEPLAELVDYANVEGRGFADAVYKNFVQPFKDVGRAAEEAKAWVDDSWAAKAKRGISKADDWIGQQALGRGEWERQRKIIEQGALDRAYLRDMRVDRPLDFKAGVFPNDSATAGRDTSYEHGLRAMADVVKYGSAKDSLGYFNPPRADEPIDSVKFRYLHLQRVIKDAEKLVNEAGVTQMEPYLKSLKDARFKFAEPYSSPQWGENSARWRMENFIEKTGKVPPRRDDYTDPPLPVPAKNNRETLRDMVAGFRDRTLGGLAQEEIRGHFGKIFEGVRKDQATARALGGGIALAGLGPFASAAPEVTEVNKGRLTLPGTTGLTPHQMELSKRVKDDFDPMLKLNRDLADLDGLFKAGGLSKPEYEFARNKEVRGLADNLGLNQPAKLPDTVLAGSEADARLLSQAMGGQQQKTTEDLLRQIADHLRSIRESSAAMERGAARPIGADVMMGIAGSFVRP
jgi:hypothetical protein